MESVAPALEEVLRQCLEDGVFRVKLHATVSMRRGDEVEDKTFFIQATFSAGSSFPCSRPPTSPST
jgi:hypothetical protein